MRLVFLASLLAGCAVGPEPAEPIPPPPPPVDVTSPFQTPSTLVLARAFDQACTRDDECVAVYEGNACTACRCANAAIHRDALPKYRAEIGAYWACYAPEDCGADCQAVTGDAAICVANKCTLPGI
ncbi:MAG: hypothetical protein H0T65_05580 [Deltaproteobacteria bacterium]|nr:hypothetical protein [Deltaproteobacteria bacterium]